MYKTFLSDPPWQDLNSQSSALDIHTFADLYTAPPGSDPMIITYNANVERIYNTMSSLVHFENTNIFFVNSEVVRFAPT
jgi:hypothetical protein